MLALLPLGLPILGVGVAYTSELVYLQHFGVPAWMLPRPEAVDVAAVMLPLFLGATIVLGLLTLASAALSAGWTRAVVAVVTLVAGVRHGLAGPGAHGVGWWGAAAGGAYLVWVGGLAWRRTRRPAPALRWPRLRAFWDRVRKWWAGGADSDASWRRWLAGLPAAFAGAPRATGADARRAQLERVEWVVLLALSVAITALEGAVMWGQWRAQGQVAFDLAGVNGEWVVLRRFGEQQLAVGRDTVCKRVLRLTGAVALLKAGPDSEPFVVRRETLAQIGQAEPARPPRPAQPPEAGSPDPPQCGAGPGKAAGATAGAAARASAPPPAAQTGRSAGHPDAVPPVACPAGLADSAVRLVVVERRRVPAWRVTYVVRRGPLRGDSLRVAVPAAPTAAAAACRADSVLVGALGAAFGGGSDHSSGAAPRSAPPVLRQAPHPPAR